MKINFSVNVKLIFIPGERSKSKSNSFHELKIDRKKCVAYLKFIAFCHLRYFLYPKKKRLQIKVCLKLNKLELKTFPLYIPPNSVMHRSSWIHEWIFHDWSPDRQHPRESFMNKIMNEVTIPVGYSRELLPYQLVISMHFLCEVT